MQTLIGTNALDSINVSPGIRVVRVGHSHISAEVSSAVLRLHCRRRRTTRKGDPHVQIHYHCF